MSARRRVNIVAAALLLFSMTGAMAMLYAIDGLGRSAVTQEALYINSPKVLRRLSLGYTGLLADIYWTRAVQYFGTQHHKGSSDFRLLAPLLEVTTELEAPEQTVPSHLALIFWLQNRRPAQACLAPLSP